MKKSIISIIVVSISIQILATLFLYSVEKKYPDFDHNSLPVQYIGQDAPDFYRLANNLRNNFSFSLDNKDPETFRTPGYPFFLALTGGGFFSLLFSIFITVGSSILVFLIAQKFLPYRYALAAGLLYTVSPSVIFHGVVFLSDGLFTFLLLVSVYLFFFKRRYFWIGIVIGIATLVRPIGMYLPFLFLLFPPFEKRKILLVLGFLVVVTPWMIRNHSISISSITTYNMAFYNLPGFVKSESYTAHLRDVESKYNLRQLKNQSILKEIVAQELQGNYVKYALYHLSYIPKFLISSPIRYISINTGNIFNDFIGINGKLISILSLDRLYMIILTGLAFLSIMFVKKDKDILVFFILIAYFAVLTGPVAIPRYRLPVDGFVIILALYFIYSIMPAICKRLRPTP